MVLVRFQYLRAMLLFHYSVQLLVAGLTRVSHAFDTLIAMGQSSSEATVVSIPNKFQVAIAINSGSIWGPFWRIR
ncbi:hypothetical protein QQP08_008406 [Theobroma cacao]|nr:hypothetical protein QQP08_008406 [Theobroma cacao]